MGSKQGKEKRVVKVKADPTDLSPTSMLDNKPPDKIDFDWLASSTGLTKEEVLLWHTSFMNECPDGYLTYKTLTKTFKKIYPHGDPRKLCRLLFNVIDKNGDNRIDFVEYMHAIAIMNTSDTSQRLSLTFRIYDHNKDGLVTEKEIEKTVEAILALNDDNEPAASKMPTLRRRRSRSTSLSIQIDQVEENSENKAKRRTANIVRMFKQELDMDENDESAVFSIDEIKFLSVCKSDANLISVINPLFL